MHKFYCSILLFWLELNLIMWNMDPGPFVAHLFCKYLLSAPWVLPTLFKEVLSPQPPCLFLFYTFIWAVSELFCKTRQWIQMWFEFNGNAWLDILPLTSCVTLDLSLNFCDLQCFHITTVASQICGEASRRTCKPCPPSLLLPAASCYSGPL